MKRALPMAWPASVILHGLFIAALGTLTLGRPLSTPSFQSIDVSILSEGQFRSLVTPPTPLSEVVVSPPSRTPGPTPATPPAPSPSTFGTGEDTIRATDLRAGELLKEPKSAEVRATLPTLAPYERVTQLCNIEAVEQLRMAVGSTSPDSVSASAFAETELNDGRLIASGAAYRSGRMWYGLRFVCTVRPDLEAVTAFELQMGDPIPEAEWDAHGLVAEDEDED